MTKGIGWKKKSTNTNSSLTPMYTYCYMWLKCNYFGHNWEQMMCCHVSIIFDYLEYYYYYYLENFKNV